MEIYEKPIAKILVFMPQAPIASENMPPISLVDDSVSLGETPSFSEGVEEW